MLSGTGSDGAEGVRAIKAEDGVTFAQDPGSAAFGAMPQAAVATGAVDVCLPVPRDRPRESGASAGIPLEMRVPSRR